MTIFHEYNSNILVVSNGIEGVYFYNIEDFKEPEFISSIYTDMSSFKTYITSDNKNLVSVGLGNYQVVIIDIINIKKPFIKSRYSESKGAFCAGILENYAMVAFQKPLTIRAFTLLPKTEINFEFYDI